jgi:GNAT superfamily N-acetyltransferase
MRDVGMLIRRETPQDVDAISAVTTAAFRRRAREPPDTALVSRLRADVGWLPALSMVAVTDDAVIGHVLCTRGFVDDTPALGLGPISVLPDRQGGGVGHALMHSVLGAADASGEPLAATGKRGRSRGLRASRAHRSSTRQGPTERSSTQPHPGPPAHEPGERQRAGATTRTRHRPSTPATTRTNRPRDNRSAFWFETVRLAGGSPGCSDRSPSDP